MKQCMNIKEDLNKCSVPLCTFGFNIFEKNSLGKIHSTNKNILNTEQTFRNIHLHSEYVEGILAFI